MKKDKKQGQSKHNYIFIICDTMESKTLHKTWNSLTNYIPLSTEYMFKVSGICLELWDV